jgi:hypothetical protein
MTEPAPESAKERADRLLALRGRLAEKYGIEPHDPLAARLAALEFQSDAWLGHMIQPDLRLEDADRINQRVNDNNRQFSELLALLPEKPTVVQVIYPDALYGVCAKCGHVQEMDPPPEPLGPP